MSPARDQHEHARIRVNTFGHARGRRFVFLSPAPPLPCEFPWWQSNRRLSLGMCAWEQGHCPICHQMCFKALALMGGITGDSLVPPKTCWLTHFTSGCISAEGCILLWGQIWWQSTLGMLAQPPGMQLTREREASGNKKGACFQCCPIPMRYEYCLWM